MLEVLMGTYVQDFQLSYLPYVASHTESKFHGEYLYVAGGLSTTNNSMTDFARYSMETKEWESLANLPAPRRTGVMAINDQYVIYAGGFNQIAGGTSAISDAIYKYTIATNTWETLTVKSPMVMSESASFQIDDENLLFLGGYTYGGTIGTNIYNLNFTGGNVTITTVGTTGSASIRRTRPILLNGELYFAGGTNSSSVATNTFWKYNLTSKIWTKLTDLPLSSNSVSLGIKDGEIHAFIPYSLENGYNNWRTKYDPVSNQWTTPITFPGRILALTLGEQRGDSIYIPGGYNGTSRVKRFRYFLI